jgi:hypothetical protein
MDLTNDKNEENKIQENIRTEYAAISAKLNQLPSFRFALAGFYIAAVGVIASVEQPAEIHFIVLIGLTTVLWIMDLRTRGLLANITNRGIQIEREYWGYKGWISHMTNEKPLGEIESNKSSVVENDTVKWFFWKIKLPRFVSHSLSFDLLFLGVLTYSVIQLLNL